MLSIITNFGCDMSCPYCIWQGHSLQFCKTTFESTNWNKLENLIKNQKRISISGGGDPLFQIEKNGLWWNKIIEITKKYNILVDLHTAKIGNPKFVKRFNKYVYHAQNYIVFKQLYKYLLKLQIPIRVVLVADRNYTENDYLEMSAIAAECSFSLSIRQLVENGKAIKINHDFLKTEQGWKYIKQGDYNTYFMPNNKIYDKFLI